MLTVGGRSAADRTAGTVWRVWRVSCPGTCDVDHVTGLHHCRRSVTPHLCHVDRYRAGQSGHFITACFPIRPEILRSFPLPPPARSRHVTTTMATDAVPLPYDPDGDGRGGEKEKGEGGVSRSRLKEREEFVDRFDSFLRPVTFESSTWGGGFVWRLTSPFKVLLYVFVTNCDSEFI